MVHRKHPQQSSGICKLGSQLSSAPMLTRAAPMAAYKSHCFCPLCLKQDTLETYCTPNMCHLQAQDYLDDLCASYGSVITLAYYIAVPANATDPAAVISADLNVIKQKFDE